ncbi:MAG: tRNA uridine-5-carboxymethylaminomethyl(34) synthesis GTPase MnmE [Bacteroidales bacterium]|nr:tRNA uridine-5-carboxymethylaminomethyl(34) synthesis GTPase MnmE [Bacteroidales bacterium]
MSTIAAISTPSGVGGIAVVRLSGPDAFAIASRHVYLPLPHHDHPSTAFTHFKIDGKMLDDVVATVFPSPRSYTGDDTVEISCHGSPYIQQALLQALLDSGARLAEPGEFTRRAFLNGKLDLSQAEAVADLIDATNAAAHSLALSQLRGGYAQELAQLRQQLVDLTALLELELDFSDEDLQFADRSHLLSLVSLTSSRVCALRQSFRMGNALKRGIPVAIIGRPNAGKSSLLNALIHDNRAIVSDIPGTTRDTIEETFTIDGTPFRIIDTAGLRHSDDPIETLGIHRTISTVAQADIILYVLDATQPFSHALDDLQELQNIRSFSDKHLFIVNNKIDLLPDLPLAPSRTFPLSAKEGSGLEALTAALVNTVRTDLAQSPDVMLTNARHYEALGHVDQALLHVAKGLADGLPADLFVVDLRDALYHLGTITGQVTTDEVLGNIFSRFCIGK